MKANWLIAHGIGCVVLLLGAFGCVSSPPAPGPAGAGSSGSDALDVHILRIGENKKVHVMPRAFSKESEGVYTNAIANFTAQGFGNAIWQEVEAVLARSGFEVVTMPYTEDAYMQILRAHLESEAVPERGPLFEKPDYVLGLNCNYEKVTSQSLKGVGVSVNTYWDAVLHFRMYDIGSGRYNVPRFVGSGEGRDPSHLAASRQAARIAMRELFLLMAQPR